MKGNCIAQDMFENEHRKYNVTLLLLIMLVIYVYTEK
jgi:hypothetical protein